MEGDSVTHDPAPSSIQIVSCRSVGDTTVGLSLRVGAATQSTLPGEPCGRAWGALARGPLTGRRVPNEPN